MTVRRTRRRALSGRTIRTRLATTSLVVGVVLGGAMIAPSNVAAAATTAPGVKMITCADKAVVRPTTFIITCADANTLLTRTHWSSWNSSSATGTTRFGMNSCKPYCAASPITYYPNATVHLTKPESTKYGRIFSTMSVVYKVKGSSKAFWFSWNYLAVK